MYTITHMYTITPFYQFVNFHVSTLRKKGTKAVTGAVPFQKKF